MDSANNALMVANTILFIKNALTSAVTTKSTVLTDVSVEMDTSILMVCAQDALTRQFIIQYTKGANVKEDSNTYLENALLCVLKTKREWIEHVCVKLVSTGWKENALNARNTRLMMQRSQYACAGTHIC